MLLQRYLSILIPALCDVHPSQVALFRAVSCMWYGNNCNTYPDIILDLEQRLWKLLHCTLYAFSPPILHLPVSVGFSVAAKKSIRNIFEELCRHL